MLCSALLYITLLYLALLYISPLLLTLPGSTLHCSRLSYSASIFHVMLCSALHYFEFDLPYSALLCPAVLYIALTYLALLCLHLFAHLQGFVLLCPTLP